MGSGAGRPRARCVVRTAEPNEHDRIHEILSIAFGPDRSNEVIDGFQRRSMEETQLVFLATVGRKTVGCVIAELCDTVIIYNLAVLPDHREMGVADTLVQRAMELMCRDHRPTFFFTAVHPDRPRGAARFSRLGFKEVGVEDGYLLMMRRAVS